MEQVLYELPDGWDWSDLNSACLLITDGAHASPKIQLNGMPYITVRDVDNAGNIDLVGCKKISEEDFDSLIKGNCSPNEGAVLFSKDGTVGKVALVKNYDPFVVLSSLAILEPKPDQLMSEYLRWFMLSPALQEDAIGKKTGAAIKRIVLRTIKTLVIPLPPLNEQKRIVTKLDALFTRINTAIIHLQKILELSKALFASALDGEFSSLSDRVNISDIADVKGGKRLPKGNKLQDEPSSYPYIRVADFTNAGSIDVSGLKYISDEIYQQIKRYTITSKDLYISIAGTIGKTGIIPENLDGANLTENAAKLVFKEPNNINVRYLYYFTLSHDFSEQAGLATKVVAQPKLALTRLSKIQVPVPQIEIQQQIVDNLDTLSDRTQALEADTQEKLNDLTALKASLLDVAFKGQL